MRHLDVRSRRIVPLVASFVLAAAATEAQAQHRHHGRRPPRSIAGVQFGWAEPQGEFAYFVDYGFGLGAHGVFSLDRQRVFGLRLDGTMVIYGHERFSQPLSSTIPRVRVDVTTDNIIASGFIGPQITVGYGAVRPYLHGGFGFSYFSTYSTVHDDYYHHVASSTNLYDLTPALSGGGGLYLALSRRVMVDLAAQYIRNGRVRYMREGGVYEEPDGSLWFEVIESEANLWVWKLGVSFGIG